MMTSLSMLSHRKWHVDDYDGYPRYIYLPFVRVSSTCKIPPRRPPKKWMPT